MNGSSVVLLLGLLTACVFVIGCTLLFTVHLLLRLLQQLEALLPDCQRTLREAQLSLGQARQLLTRGNKTMFQIQEMVSKTGSVVLDIGERLSSLKARAQNLWADRLGFGNGFRTSHRKSSHR